MALAGHPRRRRPRCSTRAAAAAAYPARAPVAHWPRPAELDRLRDGAQLLVGPLGEAEPRVLTYAAVPAGRRPCCCAWPRRAGLVEDMRERRQLTARAHARRWSCCPGGRAGAVPRAGLQAGLRRARSTPTRRPWSACGTRDRPRRGGTTPSAGAWRSEIRDREAMARAGELTAGIVHEVRNGLGTILGYARLLEKAAARPRWRRPARIREECETLETLVRRFMDFVKGETLSLAPLRLARMLSRVVARETRAGPGGDRRCGRPDAPSLADEELLERAFENLIRNAREAAGPRGHVWVDWRAEGDSVVITVADDGPGLPAEVRGSSVPSSPPSPAAWASAWRPR